MWVGWKAIGRGYSGVSREVPGVDVITFCSVYLPLVHGRCAYSTCGLVTRIGGLRWDGCLVWVWLETLESRRKVPSKSLSFLPLKSRPSLPSLRSFLQASSKPSFLPSKTRPRLPSCLSRPVQASQAFLPRPVQAAKLRPSRIQAFVLSPQDPSKPSVQGSSKQPSSFQAPSKPSLLPSKPPKPSSPSF